MAKKRKKKYQPRSKGGGSKSEMKRKVLETFHEMPHQALNYKRIAKKLNVKKEAVKKLVQIVMEELGESGELIKVDRGKFQIEF